MNLKQIDEHLLHKIDFNVVLPQGLEYHVYDISGKILKKGLTENNLFSESPIGKKFLFLYIKGYQVKKYIKPN